MKRRLHPQLFWNYETKSNKVCGQCTLLNVECKCVAILNCSSKLLRRKRGEFSSPHSSCLLSSRCPRLFPREDTARCEPSDLTAHISAEIISVRHKLLHFSRVGGPDCICWSVILKELLSLYSFFSCLETSVGLKPDI